MVGGSATVDALNTIDLESSYLTTYFNDVAANHTTSGWVTSKGNLATNGTGTYGVGSYKIKSLSKFHFHSDLVYRDQTVSTNGLSNTGLENSGGSLGFDYRGDNVTTKIRFDVGIVGDAGKVVTVETGEFGSKLTSSSINGAIIKGYYGGGLKYNRTGTGVFPTLTGNDVFYENALSSGNLTTRTAGSKFLLFAHGNTDWTDTDEANLYTMMTAYKTAVGI